MPLVADSRVLRVGSVAAVGAIVLSFVLAAVGEPWRTAVAGLVAVALVALGSPHGALDHLALAAQARREGLVQADGAPRATARARSPFTGLSARFVVAYVALALASLGAYLVAPRAGFAAFLVLSVAHFAAGEAGVAIERGLARTWRDPFAWVAGLGGAVIVVLPLASRQAGDALRAVDPRLAPVLAPLPTIAVVVSVLAVVAVAWCLVAEVRGDGRARTVALELVTLTALAWLAHPLLAFAAFFAFWHSLRHQARLAEVLRPGAGAPEGFVGRPLREVVASARAGLPATAGVLGVAGLLALTGPTVLGALLAVIWALTVPHAVAVAVMEVRGARGRGTDAGVTASKRHGTTTGHLGTTSGPHQGADLGGTLAARGPRPRAERVRG